MSTLLSDFVHHIEDNIYGNELIYRSVIVVQNQTECSELKAILEDNDHNVCIYKYNKYIDFNKIDRRILIVCVNEFKSFIYTLDKISDGLQNSSFNFIAFCSTIDDNHIKDMKEEYFKLSNNNINNSILYNSKIKE